MGTVNILTCTVWEIFTVYAANDISGTCALKEQPSGTIRVLCRKWRLPRACAGVTSRLRSVTQLESMAPEKDL